MDEKEFIIKATKYLENNNIDCSGHIIEIDSGCLMQPINRNIDLKEFGAYSLHEIAVALAHLTDKKIEYID